MRILVTEHEDWHLEVNVGLPTNADKMVFDLLVRDRRLISNEYTLVEVWFSKLFHERGVEGVQRVVDELTGKTNKRYVFVCGHAGLIAEVKFYDNIVCTYHAKAGDSFIALPMPPFTVSDKRLILPFSQRRWEASFVGSFATHSVRAEIQKAFLGEEHSTVQDIGKWHYAQPGMEEQERRKQNYVEVLGDTKIAICPRGFGLGSIRLWEAFYSGCVPLIVSDEYRCPLEEELDWRLFSLRVKESEVEKIPSMIDEMDPEELEKMATRVAFVYNTFFAADRLHLAAIRAFQRKPLCTH